jgi:hypothetical protein
MAKKPTKKSAAKPQRPAQPAGVRIYTLDVQLIDGPVTEQFIKANPKVIRTIEVRGDQTLEDLHWAIYDAFDREEEHMYEFQFGKKPMDERGRRYTMTLDDDPFGMDESDGPAEETTLDSLGLKAKQTFFYWFDFGDDWWHAIKVASIEEKAPTGQYPKVVNQIGASPPQYPALNDEEEEEWSEEE